MQQHGIYAKSVEWGGGSCIFQRARALCVTVTVFTQVVNMLRSQITKLDEIKKERETLEGEIKAVTFDMSVSFLTALAQDGAINEEQLSSTQLEQLYGAYNQRVQASLRTQEELLGQVQVCWQDNSETFSFFLIPQHKSIGGQKSTKRNHPSLAVRAERFTVYS